MADKKTWWERLPEPFASIGGDAHAGGKLALSGRAPALVVQASADHHIALIETEELAPNRVIVKAYAYSEKKSWFEASLH